LLVAKKIDIDKKMSMFENTKTAAVPVHRGVRLWIGVIVLRNLKVAATRKYCPGGATSSGPNPG
jgi:hypothetical protein